MAEILIVEDDRPLARMAAEYLQAEGHEVSISHELTDGLQQLSGTIPDVVILDLVLGEHSGLDLLKRARSLTPPPEVILVTAHATSQTAARAMQDGAYEYITKPYSLEEIGMVVKRIARRRALLEDATGIPSRGESGGELIVKSASMRKTLELAREVAPSSSTVLLRGESGTGKEEVARYIHHQSPRSSGAFIAINCGAIPENLLASEMFGHEKGAFTGAAARRHGAFERADGGSLLLDEIGDISPATQVHLLRAIESREITRVGGDTPVPVDVRLIAATHRNLEEMLRAEQLREDLYYRVNVFAITIAPLRDRSEDVQPLAKHFLRQLNCDPERVTSTAMEILSSYAWPGNVRELRNIIESLVIRSRDAAISAELVKSVLPPPGQSPTQLPAGATLMEVESQRIREALKTAVGNKAKAARVLGISRRRLYSRMKILGID